MKLGNNLENIGNFLSKIGKIRAKKLLSASVAVKNAKAVNPHKPSALCIKNSVADKYTF